MSDGVDRARFVPAHTMSNTALLNRTTLSGTVSKKRRCDMMSAGDAPGFVHQRTSFIPNWSRRYFASSSAIESPTKSTRPPECARKPESTASACTDDRDVEELGG